MMGDERKNHSVVLLQARSKGGDERREMLNVG